MLDEIASMFERFAKKFSTNDERALKDIRSAIAAGEQESARKRLIEILDRGLETAEAWLLLAEVLEEPRGIIFCLKQAAQLDPGRVPLGDQLSHLEASLVYYEEIMHIASGYGKWKAKANEIGLQHYSIEYDSEPEAKALLSTMERQLSDVGGVYELLRDDQEVYVGQYDVSVAMISGSGLRDRYQSEMEYKLDISLSKRALLLFCRQMVTQVEQAATQVRGYLHQKGQTRTSREPIPDNVKIFVWRRDQGRCVQCGSQEKLEFDHIIPVSKGGSNTARNLQILCEFCNRSKGANIA